MQKNDMLTLEWFKNKISYDNSNNLTLISLIE